MQAGRILLALLPGEVFAFPFRLSQYHGTVLLPSKSVLCLLSCRSQLLPTATGHSMNDGDVCALLFLTPDHLVTGRIPAFLLLRVATATRNVAGEARVDIAPKPKG